MDRDWLKVNNNFIQRPQYYFPCLDEVMEACEIWEDEDWVKLWLVSQISTYLILLRPNRDCFFFSTFLWILKSKQQDSNFVYRTSNIYTCLLYIVFLFDFFFFSFLEINKLSEREHPRPIHLSHTNSKSRSQSAKRERSSNSKGWRRRWQRRLKNSTASQFLSDKSHH